MPPGNQLYMLSVHSDSCAHSLPTWCGGNRDIMGSHDRDVSKLIVKNIVYQDPTSVEIHHLDLLKSELSVRNVIDSWLSKDEVYYFILVVDMQLPSSSNLVNFIRSYVDQVILVPEKMFLMLLHYPLSYGKSSYPALFLGNWQCFYLDGIGYRNSCSHLSVNNVFKAACFQDCKLDAALLLDAVLPKAIQYVCSQVSFYSCSSNPRSVNQDMQFTDRLTKLESILNYKFEDCSLAMVLGEKYSACGRRMHYTTCYKELHTAYSQVQPTCR
jgi:hypothetical protein